MQKSLKRFVVFAVTAIGIGVFAASLAIGPADAAIPIVTGGPAVAATAGATLLSDTFSESDTAAGKYLSAGDACLTAGIVGTTKGGIPACGTSATVDATGNGALQLTAASAERHGFVVTSAAFPTKNGLIVTFTDYAFQGGTNFGDGVTFFLTDAGKPIPTIPGQRGGSLGYSNYYTGPGLPDGYLAVGIDEYGEFSRNDKAKVGGYTFQVPETVAIRGASTISYRYLTGLQTSGSPASLPFTIGAAKATSRSFNAPTIRIVLTAAGALSVDIDAHDGKGLRNYLPPTNIVGLAGEPALPANVHLGFTGADGGATGRHQIAALNVTSIASSPVAVTQDNVTYHQNNSRTGWYSNETTLNVASVGGGGFHLLHTAKIASKSYGQPLYLSAQKIADGSIHNVLLVPDASDVVYAFDADSMKLLWQRSFTSGTAIRTQLASDTGCDDAWPNDGIIGTPVVDRSRNRMYVVVPTVESGVFHLRLHALGLANGADAVTPVEITATVNNSTLDPEYNFDRAGLLEAGGNVYVPISDHCDFKNTSSHGWLLSYDAGTLARTGMLADMTPNAIPSNPAGVEYLGSIWQSGFGIAADAANDIFFATGNGPSHSNGDFGMSVMRVPANLDLTKANFFTPATADAESKSDRDLGAGGVMLLPDQTTGSVTHLAVAGGKYGTKYLLDRDALGGFASVDKSLWEGNVAGNMWGGPAYFVDGTGTQKILYGGSPSLSAFTLSTAPYGLVQTSTTSVGNLNPRDAGIIPVVSSNGEQTGTAVVWAIQSATGGSGTDAQPVATPVKLYAFEGANLAHTLFSANAGVWKDNGSTGGVLVTPLVANGRVYLATDGEVTVWGLK